MRQTMFLSALCCSWVALLGIQAGEAPSHADYESLKAEIASLRQLMSGAPVEPARPIAQVDSMLANTCGPNTRVTTRQGRLQIGGLLQVWYYSIENDNTSWSDANQAVGGAPAGFGSNEVWDNDSFRVRRAELRFTLDIHENVTAVVSIDPAREATSFPSLPQNQSSVISGDGVAFFADIHPTDLSAGHRFGPDVQNGSGSANRLLQDAYINYHGVLPHHDVTVGQFKRRMGEEGSRDSAKLDFVERAMITQPADLRDLGVQVHGTWFDERLQYWLGVFDGAGTAFQQKQNRSDDNDDKDWVGTLLLRPVWKDETWGSLELGYSLGYGMGGESGGRPQLFGGVDGLNRQSTVHLQQYGWASYAPGGPVRGWWLRGEWGQIRDRFTSLEVDVGLPGTVLSPAPFNIEGWNFSTGYKLSESIWGDGLRGCGGLARTLFEPMEFTFRYDVMANLFHPDRIDTDRELDIFKTQVWTAGINYYIKGHNAKIQVNYNWVLEEDRVDIDAAAAADRRQVREVRNNNLVINLQVAW